jgi:hypothetical protein
VTTMLMETGFCKNTKRKRVNQSQKLFQNVFIY